MQIYELYPCLQNMPFHLDFSTPHSTVLFWKYDDKSDEFDHNALIEPENFQRIEHYHPKKLSEYLMVRRLLKMVLPNHKILYKTIGQPYLHPKDAFISITHSFPFAALAVSNKRVGIDIEKIMPKILKIKEKFLHDSELQWTQNENEVEWLTVIWVIKEALYKLHPSKYWSLKKHYRVEPFSLEDTSAICCSVFDEQFTDSYNAKVFRMGEYYFALVEEHHVLNFKISSGSLF